MKYINTETLDYPVSESQIKALFPSTTFATPFVAPEPFAAVYDGIFPTFNPNTHYVVESAPINDNGVWRSGWALLAYSPEELAIINDTQRNNLVLAVKSIRDEKIQNNGFNVGADWFHSDTFSRTQQIALFSLGANIPAGLQWKTMDGSFIEMTQTLAQQIFDAAVISDLVIFAYAESLISQINIAQDPTSVNINSGWPAGFEV